MFFQDLLDEHAQGLLGKIFNKLFFLFEYLTDNIGQEHILPALSVVATVAFTLAVGYLMVYLVRLEEENLKNRGKLDSNSGINNIYYKNSFLFIWVLLQCLN